MGSIGMAHFRMSNLDDSREQRVIISIYYFHALLLSEETAEDIILPGFMGTQTVWLRITTGASKKVSALLLYVYAWAFTNLINCLWGTSST